MPRLRNTGTRSKRTSSQQTVVQALLGDVRAGDADVALTGDRPGQVHGMASVTNVTARPGPVATRRAAGGA